jgi:hypothetical protein
MRERILGFLPRPLVVLFSRKSARPQRLEKVGLAQDPLALREGGHDLQVERELPRDKMRRRRVVRVGGTDNHPELLRALLKGSFQVLRERRNEELDHRRRLRLTLVMGKAIRGQKAVPLRFGRSPLGKTRCRAWAGTGAADRMMCGAQDTDGTHAEARLHAVKKHLRVFLVAVLRVAPVDDILRFPPALEEEGQALIGIDRRGTRWARIRIVRLAAVVAVRLVGVLATIMAVVLMVWMRGWGRVRHARRASAGAAVFPSRTLLCSIKLICCASPLRLSTSPLLLLLLLLLLLVLSVTMTRIAAPGAGTVAAAVVHVLLRLTQLKSSGAPHAAQQILLFFLASAARRGLDRRRFLRVAVEPRRATQTHADCRARDTLPLRR